MSVSLRTCCRAESVSKCLVQDNHGSLTGEMICAYQFKQLNCNHIYRYECMKLYPVGTLQAELLHSFILQFRELQKKHHEPTTGIYMNTILFELISPDDMRSQRSVTASPTLSGKDRSNPA